MPEMTNQVHAIEPTCKELDCSKSPGLDISFVLVIILDFKWTPPVFKEWMKLFIFEEVTSRVIEIADNEHTSFWFSDTVQIEHQFPTLLTATFETICTISHSARDVRDGKALQLEYSRKIEICVDKFKDSLLRPDLFCQQRSTC